MRTKEKIKSDLFNLAKIENNEDNVSIKRYFEKEAEYVLQYADEQSIAFTEWLQLNCKKTIYIGRYKFEKKEYTITELLEIFKNETK